MIADDVGFLRGSGLIFCFCGVRDAFEVDNAMTIVYLEQRELSAAWRASGEILKSSLFLLMLMRISVTP